MENQRKDIETQRKYIKEIKRDAVNRVVQKGKSCQEVAGELGIACA